MGRPRPLETVPPLDRYSWELQEGGCEPEEQASEHVPLYALLQFLSPASCLRPCPDFAGFCFWCLPQHEEGNKLKHLASSFFRSSLILYIWGSLPGAPAALTQHEESRGGNCTPGYPLWGAEGVSAVWAFATRVKRARKARVKEGLSLSVRGRSCIEFQPSSAFLQCPLPCHRGQFLQHHLWKTTKTLSPASPF